MFTILEQTSRWLTQQILTLLYRQHLRSPQLSQLFPSNLSSSTPHISINPLLLLSKTASYLALLLQLPGCFKLLTILCSHIAILMPIQIPLLWASTTSASKIPLSFILLSALAKILSLFYLKTLSTNFHSTMSFSWPTTATIQLPTTSQTKAYALPHAQADLSQTSKP